VELNSGTYIIFCIQFHYCTTIVRMFAVSVTAELHEIYESEYAALIWGDCI
jgi:hypothetical protein